MGFLDFGETVPALIGFALFEKKHVTESTLFGKVFLSSLDRGRPVQRLLQIQPESLKDLGATEDLDLNPRTPGVSIGRQKCGRAVP